MRLFAFSFSGINFTCGLCKQPTPYRHLTSLGASEEKTAVENRSQGMINKVVLNSPTEPPTPKILSYRIFPGILYGVLFLYLFIAVPSSTELICGILSRVRNQGH